MSFGNHQITSEELDRFLEGELTLSKTREIEERTTADAQLRKRLDASRRLRAAIGALEVEPDVGAWVDRMRQVATRIPEEIQPRRLSRLLAFIGLVVAAASVVIIGT